MTEKKSEPQTTSKVILDEETGEITPYFPEESKETKAHQAVPYTESPPPATHNIDVKHLPTVQERTFDLLQTALNNGIDPDGLEKLVNLQIKVVEQDAKAAYNEAMTKFQTIAEEVMTNAQADAGKFKWSYAKLHHIVKTIRPQLKECELSFKHEYIREGEQMYIRCVAKHSKGHSEYAEFPIIDNSDSYVSEAQTRGASVQYAKNKSFCMVFGITIADEEENDGQPEPETITEEEIAKIRKLLKETNTEEGKFLSFIKVESLDKILSNNFEAVCSALNKKKALKKK